MFRLANVAAFWPIWVQSSKKGQFWNQPALLTAGRSDQGNPCESGCRSANRLVRWTSSSCADWYSVLSAPLPRPQGLAGQACSRR